MTNPPQKTEWLLLFINITFVVMGLVLLPSSPDMAIVTLAFFGTCLVTTLAFQWRRHLDGLFSVQTVAVVGGVKINPQRRIILLMGAWLMALGTVMYIYSDVYPVIFQWLCLLLVIIGAGLLVAALCRYLPRGFLQFDPDGLTIGEGTWQAKIPWTEFTHVTEGEYHMNPVVRLDIYDLDAVTISPPGFNEKARKHMSFNKGMLGAPFMLMPLHYGIPCPVLAGAIRRYCKSEKARAGLRKVLELQS